jgi:acylphosphatase
VTRSVRLTITGRVQGVGYRIWAERAAGALGIRGWVRNRSDGSVELQASGSKSAIAALIEACRQGPRAAVVADVTVVDAEDDGSAGFGAQPTA